MLRIIRQHEFIEGRWRNGMGTSWEIAALREEEAVDFSWRFAKARIERDVPFSIYPGMDRVFMQIEGKGLDLEFEGGKVLKVHESFVPHAFSCDIPLNCKLLGGPCMDLNLFTKRGSLGAHGEVVTIDRATTIQLPTSEAVVFVLQGQILLGGNSLESGDAAHAKSERQIYAQGKGAKVFVGHLG